MELGAAWPCHGIVGTPVLWKYTCRDSVWNFVLNTCGYPATSIVSSGQAGERVWSGRGAGHHFGEMNGRQQQVVVYKLPQRQCAERALSGFCLEFANLALDLALECAFHWKAILALIAVAWRLGRDCWYTRWPRRRLFQALLIKGKADQTLLYGFSVYSRRA